MIAKLLNADDVATLLGLSKSFVYTLVRTGQLKAMRFGSAVRFCQDDLEKYIQQNTVNGSATKQSFFPQP